MTLGNLSSPRTIALVAGVLVIGALAMIPMIPPLRRYVRIKRM